MLGVFLVCSCVFVNMGMNAFATIVHHIINRVVFVEHARDIHVQIAPKCCAASMRMSSERQGISQILFHVWDNY